MGQIKRTLILLFALTLLVTALATPAQAGAAGTLLSRINSSRASAGLPPVETYWDLTDDARAHSARMAAEGRIFHNTNLGGVTGVWLALNENVGVGWDPNELHDSFMSSGPHRANILGNYNYVGIGTATDGEGLLYVTVIFMRAEPGLNGGGTTTTTVPPTTTTTTAPPADPPPNVPPGATTTTTTTTPTTTTKPKAAAKSTGEKTVASSKGATERQVIVGYGHPDGAFVD